VTRHEAYRSTYAGITTLVASLLLSLNSHCREQDYCRSTLRPFTITSFSSDELYQNHNESYAAQKQSRVAKTILPKSTTGGSNIQDVVGRNLKTRMPIQSCSAVGRRLLFAVRRIMQCKMLPMQQSPPSASTKAPASNCHSPLSCSGGKKHVWTTRFL